MIRIYDTDSDSKETALVGASTKKRLEKDRISKAKATKIPTPRSRAAIKEDSPQCGSDQSSESEASKL